MKKRLAEAEAAQQASKKPEEKVQIKAPAGGALHEWVCMLALRSDIYFLSMKFMLLLFETRDVFIKPEGSNLSQRPTNTTTNI